MVSRSASTLILIDLLLQYIPPESSLYYSMKGAAHKMLYEIVDRAVAKVSRRYRGLLEISDLRQEAWASILESQEAGILDPRTLEMNAIRCLRSCLESESLKRHEFPSRFL